MVSKAILQKKKCEKCFFVEDLAPYTQSAIFLGSSWIFMSRLCADFHKRYGLWNVFPTRERYTQEEIKSSNMSFISPRVPLCYKVLLYPYFNNWRIFLRRCALCNLGLHPPIALTHFNGVWFEITSWRMIWTVRMTILMMSKEYFAAAVVISAEDDVESAQDFAKCSSGVVG